MPIFNLKSKLFLFVLLTFTTQIAFAQNNAITTSEENIKSYENKIDQYKRTIVELKQKRDSIRIAGLKKIEPISLKLKNIDKKDNEILYSSLKKEESNHYKSLFFEIETYNDKIGTLSENLIAEQDKILAEKHNQLIQSVKDIKNTLKDEKKEQN
jgi:hypothetical protein